MCTCTTRVLKLSSPSTAATSSAARFRLRSTAVAIPAKDVLLVTGSRDRKGLKTVGELVGKFVAQQRYTVSDALFVFRNGRFARFGCQ
jgi:uncharacterized protein YtpQ (UPF0354 family)